MLLEKLPSSSVYVDALANDEDYARQAAGAPAPPRTGPRLSEWSTEADLLARVVDRLGEMLRVSVSAAGGKPGELRPIPRPVTAVDRARRDQRYLKHLSLVAEVRDAQRRFTEAEGGTAT